MSHGRCRSCEPFPEPGDMFGLYVVTAESFIDANRHHERFAPCRCEGCGIEKNVLWRQLRDGKSNGCQKCMARRSNHKHGHAAAGGRSAEFSTWSSMRSRCLNRNNPRFQSYGGRGIEVCERWRDSFEAFLSDMGRRPPGTSIDRIDNDGNYEPGNCRWATPREQQRNRRVCRVLTFNGRTQTIPEWTEEMGFRRSTLDTRLRRGWSVEDALGRPVQRRCRERGCK